MQVANRPTVMVADYSADTRELLRFWLETEGCRVVEAVNGHEAIELTRGECPDLIVMSLRMPGRSGFDAARCIREDDRECNVPIVAMSTYPTQEEKAKALAAGCSSFIAHPIDFDLLSSLLPASARLSSRAMAGA
jgi:CheY-like chemotaxis protein